MNIIAIDPGQKGAIVWIKPDGTIKYYTMPLTKEKRFDFFAFQLIIKNLPKFNTIYYLERALAMAMGAGSAFSYGRDFGRLEIALEIEELDVTLIEPSKWCKEMHEGLNPDLKPKAKSLLAIQTNYPQYIPDIPKSKSGKYHDGVVDALLIGLYAKKQQK